MKNHVLQFPVEKMASVLGVTRGGYYRFLKTYPCARSIENKRLLEKIKAVHEKSFDTYGSPRIHAELRAQGEKCSRKRVAKLMRSCQIISKMDRKFKKTTRQSASPAHVAKDLVCRNFSALQPNTVWVTDISYIQVAHKWVYLAVVLDLFSRRIVGMAVRERMTTDLILRALDHALFERNPNPGIIHHSDRGSQYTSQVLYKKAQSRGIRLSMGKTGSAYDNAAMESFFHTLKTECVYFETYKTLQEATLSIFSYIFGFYIPISGDFPVTFKKPHVNF